jgi:hypothetical protein
METIMSTLALELAGALAPAKTQHASWGLMHQLIKAREDQARRQVLAYLASMDDARLRSLGFGEDDIAVLRRGEARLPK